MACATPHLRLRRLTRASLWAAALAVVALAAFPSYVGVLLAGPAPGSEVAGAAASGTERFYVIDGMTCDGCAAGVRAALESLPGVASAEVSYSEKRARVRLRAAAALDDAAVSRAVATLGYEASPANGTAAADGEDPP